MVRESELIILSCIYEHYKFYALTELIWISNKRDKNIFPPNAARIPRKYNHNSLSE